MLLLSGMCTVFIARSVVYGSLVFWLLTVELPGVAVVFKVGIGMYKGVILAAEWGLRNGINCSCVFSREFRSLLLMVFTLIKSLFPSVVRLMLK